MDAVERLGSDGFVYVKTEAGTLAARFEGAVQLQVGDAAQVSVAPDSIYLFDARTEEALPLQPAVAKAVGQ